jgi:hypothetical protein
MAFATSSAVQSSTNQTQATEHTMHGGDAAMLLMGALAGAAMTKEAKRQYRALTRKMAWKALGQKFKGLFKKEFRLDDEIAGMPAWLFIVLVVGGAAIGLWLFGLLGFLVLLGLGVIIYLLIND